MIPGKYIIIKVNEDVEYSELVLIKMHCINIVNINDSNNNKNYNKLTILILSVYIVCEMESVFLFPTN